MGLGFAVQRLIEENGSKAAEPEWQLKQDLGSQ